MRGCVIMGMSPASRCSSRSNLYSYSSLHRSSDKLREGEVNVEGDGSGCELGCERGYISGYDEWEWIA